MDNFSTIVLIVWLVGILALAVRLGYKFWKSRYGKTVTVSATVLSKHTMEFYNKSLPHQQSTRYVVNFLVKNQKKGFTVSAGLYHACREGETGTLTYQGDRVISFQ